MLWVLLTGATGEMYAQSQAFEMPMGNIKRRFVISLGQGDKMQIELTDLDNLEQLSNLDSIVRVFIRDMEPLKDSLADELSAKRIDYIIDSSSIKKIRVSRYPAESQFAITNGELASLKTEQDTICITGKTAGKITGILFQKKPGYHYYRISFFLNNFSNLSRYMDGRLNEKIAALKKNMNTEWVSKGGQVYLRKQPEIFAPAAKGYISGGDFLSLRLSVDAQNYKNYFVPSISFGFAIVSNNNFVRREFGLGSEQHFMFQKNDSGKLQAFRNSFLTVSYGRSTIKLNESKDDATLYPFISVGYLLKRRGDVYDKNTFKVGLGRFSFFGGSTRIEPTIYFNNLFKGVTPSLRIVQSF